MKATVSPPSPGTLAIIAGLGREPLTPEDRAKVVTKDDLKAWAYQVGSFGPGKSGISPANIVNLKKGVI